MKLKKTVTTDVQKPSPVKKNPNGIVKGRDGKNSAGSGRGGPRKGTGPKKTVDSNRPQRVLT